MAPWVRVLEAYLVQALLRTPAFHRSVEKVARQVHRIRHGIPPEEMGGTKIDDPQRSSFLQQFADELKSQIGGGDTKRTGGVNMDSRAFDSHHIKSKSPGSDHVNTPEEKNDAESVWKTTRDAASEQPSNQGFLNEYMSALREQVRNNNKNGR